MTFRHWLRGTAALALLAGSCGAAAAQGKLSLSSDEAQRFGDIRNGGRRVDEGKGEKEKNEAAIRHKARVEVALMLDAAATADGSSDAKSIAATVKRLNDIIVDPLNPPRKLTEGQRDMIKFFGDEMVKELKPIIGTADKPSGAEILVKVNAARQLSILGKSGFDGAALYAAEILNDPKQHDAVKLYALQAIRNTFAVPHAEREGKSAFPNEKDEIGPIVALINFISRKPTFETGAPEDEVEAFRYLRREAVIALGQVRKPIVRDDGKVIAVPAIWLLRVANGDVNFAVPPSLSERIEALAGYLNLLGEKDENMDYAAWYVATAIRDLTLHYKEARAFERPKPDDKDKKPPEGRAEERDRQAWKYAATRFQVGLRVWRDNYEYPGFGIRPANVRSMLADLANKADKNVLDYIIQGGRRIDVSLAQIEDWMKSTTISNKTLFNDDPSSVVTRPDAGR